MTNTSDYNTKGYKMRIIDGVTELTEVEAYQDIERRKFEKND